MPPKDNPIVHLVCRNADTFGYDHRSQLTAATLRSSASTNAYAYAYDGAGNRQTASEPGVASSYAANALNQYSEITSTLPPPPSNLPPLSSNLSYDLDGNLLTNGVWSYEWDAENRLSAVCSNGVCVVSNEYDAFSRRVRKVTPTETRTFLYDGWNVVREVVRDAATGAVADTFDYYWGRDLSGSLQGAGGVGGLLAYTRNGALRIPVYDHIGNVVAVVDESGAVVAAYEYAPFGALVALSGPEADEVPFRFSTKYYDTETGLYYYGYRFYAPLLGRWVNRDPIEEMGGSNLYGYCNNAALMVVDYLGKASVRWGDSSQSRRCECIASKRTKSPVSLDRPLSFDMRYPTEFDHLASSETYLGQELWFETKYPGWVANAPRLFADKVNDWIMEHCSSKPAVYNERATRESIAPYYLDIENLIRVHYPNENETLYGDKPQSRWSAGVILGQFSFDIVTPIKISYRRTSFGNTFFYWETEMYVADVLGTQRDEDGALLGLFKSWIPSRQVKRAKWTISSGGLCCDY